MTHSTSSTGSKWGAIILCLLSVILPACGATEGAVGQSCATCGDAASASDASAGSESWIPPQCEGLGTPYVDEGCLEGLHETCRSLTTQEECESTSEKSFHFDEVGGEFYCEWVPVVTFSDAEACIVESVEHRCEAKDHNILLACPDACEVPPDFTWALQAVPSEGEIIKMCGGPIGPWDLVSAEPGAYLGLCIDNVQPPAPELCNCKEVACEAMRGL